MNICSESENEAILEIPSKYTQFTEGDHIFLIFVKNKKIWPLFLLQRHYT